MALSPGDRLGPYEIVGPLGAGGMGEVYRARDPRLSREVAIKVLPDAVAARRRAARALRARGPAVGGPEPRGDRLDLRRRGGRQLARSRHGIGGRAHARRAHRPRSDSSRRSADHRAPARRGARIRARPRHRAPGPQAGEHQAPSRRYGQGSGLRSRPRASHRDERLVGRAGPLADDHAADDPSRDHPGNGRLHVPRAGARARSGPALGRVGVRRGALRDARRTPRIFGRNHVRDAGLGHARRARLVGSAFRAFFALAASPRSLPDQGPAAPHAGDRRGAHRPRGSRREPTRLTVRRGGHAGKGCARPPDCADSVDSRRGRPGRSRLLALAEASDGRPVRDRVVHRPRGWRAGGNGSELSPAGHRTRRPVDRLHDARQRRRQAASPPTGHPRRQRDQRRRRRAQPLLLARRAVDRVLRQPQDAQGLDARAALRSSWPTRSRTASVPG